MATQKTANVIKGHDAELNDVTCDDLDAAGDVTVAGTLDVTGVLTHGGEVVSGVLTGDLEVTGTFEALDVTVGDDLTVTDDANIQGDLDVDGSINCDGALVVDTTTLLTGVATLSETPDLAKGILLTEQGADIDAPAANKCVLYCIDVAGKTTLFARFATGSPVEVAAEP
jgi:hypothetical protein